MYLCIYKFYLLTLISFSYLRNFSLQIHMLSVYDKFTCLVCILPKILPTKLGSRGISCCCCILVLWRSPNMCCSGSRWFESNVEFWRVQRQFLSYKLIQIETTPTFIYAIIHIISRKSSWLLIFTRIFGGRRSLNFLQVQKPLYAVDCWIDNVQESHYPWCIINNFGPLFQFPR